MNTFAGLAARRVPVGILSHATNGKPERSARYRDVLVPTGIPYELRAAFVSRGRCWGAVHIARKEDKRDFTADDANALARITGAIADGIRTTLRLDAARVPSGHAAPGLVVLSTDNDVELITPPARELLTAMRNPSQAPEDETPPAALLALAAFTRRHYTIHNGPKRSPSRPEPAGSRCTPRYPTASPAARSQSYWNAPRARSRPRSAWRRTGSPPASAKSRSCSPRGSPTPRSQPGWCSPPTPSRTTSRACSRKPKCPHAENSSPACSSTNTSPSSPSEPRSHPPAASSSTPTNPSRTTFPQSKRDNDRRRHRRARSDRPAHDCVHALAADLAAVRGQTEPQG